MDTKDERHISFLMGSEIGKPRLLRAIALANEVYRNQGVFSVTKHFEIFKANPDSFIFAVDEVFDKVLGCVMVIPVTEDLFSRSISPDFNEEEIGKQNIIQYVPGKAHSVYFCSITTDPKDSKRVTVAKGLITKFLEFVKDSLKKDIKIIKVSATAVSPEGEHLCRSFGLTHTGVSNGGHNIYIMENAARLIYNKCLNESDRMDVAKNILQGLKKSKTE